jgi:hypothetical protein
LHEREGQYLAGAGVMAVQNDAAGGTARSADIVMAENFGHENSCRAKGNTSPVGARLARDGGVPFTLNVE